MIKEGDWIFVPKGTKVRKTYSNVWRKSNQDQCRIVRAVSTANGMTTVLWRVRGYGGSVANITDVQLVRPGTPDFSNKAEKGDYELRIEIPCSSLTSARRTAQEIKTLLGSYDVDISHATIVLPSGEKQEWD